MPLTIRVFSLGVMIVMNLGCHGRSDAGATPAPSSVPESATVEHKTEPLQAAPAQPPAPGAAAEPASNGLCLAVCGKAAGLHCGAAENCSSGCEEMMSVPNCQTV